MFAALEMGGIAAGFRSNGQPMGISGAVFGLQNRFHCLSRGALTQPIAAQDKVLAPFPHLGIVAHEAHIGRYRCRFLAGSEHPDAA